MGLDVIKENMEDSYKIKLVNRLNDILSNISTMEDRVSINKAIAVVTYKRLVEMKKLSSDMDVVKRLGIITSIIDDFRESYDWLR